MNFRNPALLITVGVLLGYMGSRLLDRVPVINQLPKIR